MIKKNSILFVRPDYHCSFFYRDEFRKLGWRADIIIANNYPQDVLYSNKKILKSFQIKFEKKNFKILNYFINRINLILQLFFWLVKFWQYRYHVYYGRPPFTGSKFELRLIKFFRKKLIYLPSGCHEEETKENFSKLDNGNVCGNCGFFTKCFDKDNNKNFSNIRTYFDMIIGVGSVNSTQYLQTHMKYKSINLSFWREALYDYNNDKLKQKNNLLIFHSSYIKNSGRDLFNKDIKGTQFVIDAVDKLKKEGHRINFVFHEKTHSSQMRFYQAQADIVIDQLIYGWWGSTTVESLVLGKPTICYLRAEWKSFFLKTFPEYKSLPIIEANTKTIYEVLKKVIVDKNYRNQKAVEAIQFSNLHFNVTSNTKSFINFLEKL